MWRGNMILLRNFDFEICSKRLNKEAQNNWNAKKKAKIFATKDLSYKRDLLICQLKRAMLEQAALASSVLFLVAVEICMRMFFAFSLEDNWNDEADNENTDESPENSNVCNLEVSLDDFSLAWVVAGEEQGPWAHEKVRANDGSA